MGLVEIIFELLPVLGENIHSAEVMLSDKKIVFPEPPTAKISLSTSHILEPRLLGISGIIGGKNDSANYHLSTEPCLHYSRSPRDVQPFASRYNSGYGCISLSKLSKFVPAGPDGLFLKYKASVQELRGKKDYVLVKSDEQLVPANL